MYIFLFILSIVGLFISISKLVDDGSKLYIIGLLISMSLLIGVIVKYKIDYINTHEIETEKYVTTITDKKDKRELIGIINKVPHYTTNYYIYFDNEELKVDLNTYKTIEVGDKFVLEKVFVYKTEGDSKIFEKSYYQLQQGGN